MSGLRLLVVDDNRSLVEALRDVFESRGYSVDTAHDGLQAVEHVRAAGFDCILMDIRMPGMNGVDAFREIKKLSPTTPVILMTAYSVQGLIDEALAEGVFAVLNKPVAIDRILVILDELKGKSSILVVDVRPNPELIKALAGYGYRVAAATSVAGALAMISRHEYDVVLLNTEIQGLTTENTLVLIKECDPKCIVILMSGEKEPSVSPLAYASLQKPFKIGDVVALLERVRRSR